MRRTLLAEHQARTAVRGLETTPTAPATPTVKAPPKPTPRQPNNSTIPAPDEPIDRPRGGASATTHELMGGLRAGRTAAHRLATPRSRLANPPILQQRNLARDVLCRHPMMLGTAPFHRVPSRDTATSWPHLVGAPVNTPTATRGCARACSNRLGGSASSDVTSGADSRVPASRSRARYRRNLPPRPHRVAIASFCCRGVSQRGASSFEAPTPPMTTNLPPTFHPIATHQRRTHEDDDAARELSCNTIRAAKEQGHQ